MGQLMPRLARDVYKYTGRADRKCYPDYVQEYTVYTDCRKYRATQTLVLSQSVFPPAEQQDCSLPVSRVNPVGTILRLEVDI